MRFVRVMISGWVVIVSAIYILHLGQLFHFLCADSGGKAD